MRIITGEFKGRRLESPRDEQIRPTSDKVKGAIFSILGTDIIDAIVCDPFGGTGNLGLEAISRGASFCYFGDHAGESISLIKRNIEKCKAEDRSTITHGDYKKTIDSINQPIDIFYLDPPYKKKNVLNESMEYIYQNDKIKIGGIIVAEHHKKYEMPDHILGLKKIKEHKYGIIILSIYKNITK